MTVLTAEIREKLSAPIPQSALKTRPGRAGKDFTYADVDYLEGVLRSIDPDYHTDAQTETTRTKYGTIITARVAVKLLGVQRTDVMGDYVTDDIEYKDNNGEKHTRHVNEGDIKSAIGDAKAAAFRRVCAQFELGDELWPKSASQTQTTTTTTYQPGQQSQAKSNGATQGAATVPASEKQINALYEWYGVPKSISSTLTGGKGGQASALYDALKIMRNLNREAYDASPNLYVDAALHLPANATEDQIRQAANSIAAVLEEDFD